MPECVALIRGQESKYCGGHLHLQEEMPAKLSCMDKAEYEELRRFVDRSLEPANQAIVRVNSSWVMCLINRIPMMAFPLLLMAILLPCLIVLSLSTGTKLSLVVGLCLLFSTPLALRECGERYVDRQMGNAFTDLDKGCREFSRGKQFKVDVRRKRVKGAGRCAVWRTEYFLRIIRVLKADFAWSYVQTGTQRQAEVVPEEDASVAESAPIAEDGPPMEYVQR